MPNAHLAAVEYHGPSGYPLRFLDRLVQDREVAGAWVLDREKETWRGYVVGITTPAGGIDRLEDGDTVVVVMR